MDPAVSFLNPEIEVHGGGEEEEAAKDARIKQEELAVELQNGFDDLMIDDTFDQHSSDENQNTSEDENFYHSNVKDGGLNEFQTSTPLNNQGAPALTTPNYYQITHPMEHNESVDGVQIFPQQVPDTNHERHIHNVNGPSVENHMQLPRCNDFNNYDVQNQVNGLHQPGFKHLQNVQKISSAENRVHPPGENIYLESAHMNGDYQHIPAGDSHTGALYNENQLDYLLAGNQQAGNTNITQLQILNHAKDRQIEALNEQMKEMQEQLNKEIRILKHELNLKDDENKDISSNVALIKQQLDEYQVKNVNLEAKINVQKAQKEAFEESNKALLEKIKILEMTESNLEAELKEFHTPDNLNKERRQHEALNNLKEKHLKESFSLNEKIDKLNQKVIMKEEELEIVRHKFEDLSSAFNKMSVVKSETINKLSLNLEASQRQCQGLLESEKFQEVAQLKMELKKALSDKKDADELRKTYQKELKILKEELEVYEERSAIFSQNVIESTEKQTPEVAVTHKLDLNRTEECEADGIASVRSELKHLLADNKRKRAKILSLHEKLTSATDDISKHQKTLKQSREEIQKYEKEISHLKLVAARNDSAEFVLKEKHQELVDELSSSLDKCKVELEKHKSDCKTRNSKEEQSQKSIEELKKEMAEMIRMHDEDKQIAIDRCRNSCLRLHEENVQIIRRELMQKCSDEVDKVTTHYEQRLNDLNHNIANHINEINSLKKFYVQVCEEKNEILREKSPFKSDTDISNDFLNDDALHFKRKLEQVEKEKQELKILLTGGKSSNKQLEKRIAALQEDVKNAQNQRASLEGELQAIKLKSSSSFSKNMNSEIHQRVLEKAAIFEKELDQMVAQKNLVENELIELKSKQESELEMLKYKYAQDLNAAIHQLEDEKCLEQNKILKEIKQEADGKYHSLMQEQRRILEKYKIAEEKNNEMTKKISEFDSAISKIHDSFQCKLKDSIKDKDKVIQDLSDELSALRDKQIQPISGGITKDLLVENTELKSRIDELKLKVKKCQKYAIVKARNCHGEVVKLKTEFQMTVSNLRLQFDELKNEHKVELSTEIDRLKQKHVEIIKSLRSDHQKQLEKRQEKSSQTFDVEKLRNSYLQALYSIKSEVLNFVQDYQNGIDKRLRENLENLLLQINVPDKSE